MAFIEVYLPDGQIEHFELDKSTMIIGRSEQSDIIIRSEIVSRKHAILKKGSHGRWIIEDANSRNKTYFNNKPVKSHVLTNGDKISFGSIKAVFRDPSGKSDIQVNQTIYLDSQAETKKKAATNVCPACKAEMDEQAVICIKCGFNKKLGKRMKVVLEETTDVQAVTADTAPKPINLTPSVKSTAKTEKKKASKGKIKITVEQKQQIIDYFLPIGFIIIMLIISMVKASVGGMILNFVGVIIRSIFMLIAMAIAAKIGEFGFGDFKTAILKVIGICAALTIFSMLAPFPSFIFSIFVLLGLLKLSFDLDFFELFLIVGAMVILNNFIISAILATLASLMIGMR